MPCSARKLVQLLAAAAVAQLQVFQCAEFFHAQVWHGDAMVSADQADEVVGEQALLVDIRRVKVGEVAEGGVHAAFAQGFVEVFGAEAQAVDFGVGCGAAQAVEEGGQEHHFADFAEAESEGFAALGRVEGGAGEDFLVDGGNQFAGVFDAAASAVLGFRNDADCACSRCRVRQILCRTAES